MSSLPSGLFRLILLVVFPDRVEAMPLPFFNYVKIEKVKVDTLTFEENANL